jgi:hypothetical protein
MENWRITHNGTGFYAVWVFGKLHYSSIPVDD